MKDKLIWMLDAHCDSIYKRDFLEDDFDLSHTKANPSQKVLDKIAVEFNEKKVKFEEFAYHVSFPRLQQGNVGAVFLNVGDYDLAKSTRMLNDVQVIAKQNSDKVAICGDSKAVKQTVHKNKIAIIPSIESQLMFQGQIDLLYDWHQRGVRVASITHGEGTEALTRLAKLILGEKTEDIKRYALQRTQSAEDFMLVSTRDKLYKKELGLTGHGRLTLKEMAKLEIICDLSHANDATFWEVLELSAGKVCVTHSNCAVFCGHSRNLTDSMMKALAEYGGVMGICFYGGFIDKDEPSFDKYVRHILHALEIMGPDHVGIGSDYDGVSPDAFMAIPHPGHMNDLWKALGNIGIDEETIRKISHENFLRLLSE